MSSQSKNARKLAKAREITLLVHPGDFAKTTPKHNKRWTYRTNPETAKRIAEAMKASGEKQTVLDKMNDVKAKRAKTEAAAQED